MIVIKKKLLESCCLLFGMFLLVCIIPGIVIDDEEVAQSGWLSRFQVNKNIEENTLQNKMEINDRVYEVDASRLFSLVNNRSVTGNGYLRWKNWKNLSKESVLSGNLKIDYIDDDIYTSMKLPSEALSYMTFRVNPHIISYKPEGYVNAVGIGAIYKAVDAGELPDEFSVTFGKFKTYVLYEGDSSQWKVLDSHNILSKYSYKLFELPWSTKESKAIPSNQMEIGSDYIKIKLKKEDLDNQVLHFWGTKQNCLSEKIVGMVTIYEVWSDTPAIEGKLVATIGIDQRDSSQNIKQAFSGRNYVVTNNKRLIIGHNMPDDVYDWCVENGKSPQVCIEMFE